MSGLELEKVLGFTSILVNVQTICFESMQTSVERTLNRRKAESVTLLEIMQRGKWTMQAARVSQPAIQPTVQTSWYTRATGECLRGNMEEGHRIHCWLFVNNNNHKIADTCIIIFIVDFVVVVIINNSNNKQCLCCMSPASYCFFVLRP